MKKILLIIFYLLAFNNSVYAVVEVDITRGNLDPLPIAVSPLYIEPGSKEIKEQIRQSSEFEKKELFDPNQIAALIDKSKEETAETLKKNQKLTQSNVKTSFTNALTLSQEDALKAQIFGCWSLPLGLPYQKNLLVRIKLRLKPDGTVLRSEILDHARMNKPGQGFYKVLAESALRAIRICQPLRVPPTGYEKWKDLQLNFDANEMLKG